VLHPETQDVGLTLMPAAYAALICSIPSSSPRTQSCHNLLP
jgi:hypothetical protein